MGELDTSIKVNCTVGGSFGWTVKCHMTEDADSIMTVNTHASAALGDLWFCVVTSSNHDGSCLLQACLVFDSRLFLIIGYVEH